MEKTESRIPDLLKRDVYVIAEKAKFVKFGNTYNILDENGNNIGVIDQKVPGWQKLLSLALSKESFPYTYTIADNSGNVAATIKRGWTFFMSKIEIYDANNNKIGVMKEKMKLMHNSFEIENPEGKVIASIKSTSAGLTDFSITGVSDEKIGAIEQQWKNGVKEIATQALFPGTDKYCVTIDPKYTNDPLKTIAIAGSIVVDMSFRN